MEKANLSGADVKLERSDAIELHEALAPKEARGAPYFQFLISLGLAAVLGLVVGSVIDNTVQWLQGVETREGYPKRWTCGMWFFGQIWANITILYVLNQALTWGFVPWLLITLAGFLFTLNLVNVQETLVNNATCLLSFN
jgi:hypothetical protein